MPLALNHFSSRKRLHKCGQYGIRILTPTGSVQERKCKASLAHKHWYKIKTDLNSVSAIHPWATHKLSCCLIFFFPVSLRKEWLYPGDACELLWYKIAASSQFFRALHWHKKPHKDGHTDEMRRGKPWHLKGVCNDDPLPPPLASQQVKLASFPSSDFLLTQPSRACFREPQT